MKKTYTYKSMEETPGNRHKISIGAMLQQDIRTVLIAVVAVLQSTTGNGQQEPGSTGIQGESMYSLERKPTEFLLDGFSIFTTEEIEFRLDDDQAVVISRERVELHPTGAVSWIGKIMHQKWGYMILTQQEDISIGKIESDDGQIYQIKGSDTAERLSVRKADLPEQKEKCHELVDHIAVEDTQDAMGSRQNTLCTSMPCDDQIIDVMVLYTSRARENMGGSANVIESAIATALAEMNMINANSGIPHRMSLVHTGEVNYNEASSFQTNLTRLRSPTDGFLDAVHDLRDQHYADLVSMVVGTDECGLANVNTDSLQFDAQSSFSVIREECLMNKTFAHELGHNLGFRHDRYAYLDEEGELPDVACDYAWGFVNPEAEQGPSQARWRTVMTYPNQCNEWGFSCTRIPYWSNPGMEYHGDPTGELNGLTGSCNSCLFERAACQVTKFRESPDCEWPCKLFQGCSNYNLNTEFGPGYTTLLTAQDEFPEVTPSATRIRLCVMYFGDHNGDNERFEIFDEDQELLGYTTAAYECDLPSRVCFDIEPEVYNRWIADQKIEIILDPVTTAINPEHCRANRACLEVLVQDDSIISSAEKIEPGNDLLKLYPNPADNRVFLDMPDEVSGPLEVRLIDIMGRTMLIDLQAQPITGQSIIELDLQQIPDGVYMCMVKWGTGFSTGIVAIQ